MDPNLQTPDPNAAGQPAPADGGMQDGDNGAGMPQQPAADNNNAAAPVDGDMGAAPDMEEAPAPAAPAAATGTGEAQAPEGPAAGDGMGAAAPTASEAPAAPAQDVDMPSLGSDGDQGRPPAAPGV